MVILIGALAGGLTGWRTAVRRGGNRLDIAQYAGVGLIAGAILGTVATLILERLI